MATRFYLNTRGWPQVRPPVDSGWENANLALETWHSRRMMYTWHSGSVDEIQPFGVDNQNAVHDLLMAQYISEPLAAQTISGTIRAVIQASESNAAANMRSQMHAWVMKPDGTSRGTLTTFTTGALASEWNTSRRSAFFPVGSTGTTVSNVTTVAGDRVVVDLGARIHDTTSTQYFGRLFLGDYHWGGAGAGTTWDLPSNQTDTSTTHNGWIEFSGTLTFQTSPLAIVDDIASAVDCMPATQGSITAYAADISGFTTEADDPDSMFDVNYSGDLGFTGWTKLVGPTGGARVKVEGGGGLGVEPFIYVFDDPPTSSSAYESYNEASDPNTGVIFTDVPDGVTKYVAIMPGDGSFENFDADKNVHLVFTRARDGEIADLIADAPDLLPATENSDTVAFSPDIDFWTTEADDPQWIADNWTGDPMGYTGWFKLDVPAPGIKVTIDTYLPIDYVEGPNGTVLLVFDEVPTSTSEPIAETYGTTDSVPPTGSIDQSWMNKAKISDLDLTSGTTYYVCVVSIDGSGWQHWEEGTNLQVTVHRHFDSAVSVEEDFSTDAIVRRVTEPPIYITAPSFVAAETASVDNAGSITVAAPAGMQQGDLLIAAISADALSNTGIGLHSFVASEPGWTALHQDYAQGSASHTYATLYRFVDDPDEGITLTQRISSTPIVSAKAAALIAFRDAYIPIFRTSNGVTTASSGNKVTPGWIGLSNDPNFEASITLLGFWAGANTGSTTWTAISPVTERADVTAANNANLMLGTWTDTFDSFVESQGATPSGSEFNLTQVIHIPHRTTTMGVSAEILPGGYWSIDAVVATDITTKHDRTRYHYGMTPAEDIISSRTYGAFPPGTTLQEVLEGLDSLITDLENQS